MIQMADIELTQYSMSKWTLEKTETGVQMIVIFKRMVTSELLTTYMPSLLLILTTYATTFFKPFYFEAAVTVNLTTMLVMTTIFTNIMDKLPPTAYVKMIDVWLIGGQLIPFVEVVLLTVIENLRDGDGSGMMTLNHHGQERKVQVDSRPPTPAPMLRVQSPKKANGNAEKEQEPSRPVSVAGWVRAVDAEADVEKGCCGEMTLLTKVKIVGKWGEETVHDSDFSSFRGSHHPKRYLRPLNFLYHYLCNVFL